MRKVEDYISTLKSKQVNLYFNGDLIRDITSHPQWKKIINSHALFFKYAQSSDYESLLTTKSHLTGEKIYRFNSLTKTAEDLINYHKCKRFYYENTGTCVPGLCVGWVAQNALWDTTWRIDQEYGTNYNKRLRDFICKAQSGGYVVTCGLTDAKGDRSKKASDQLEKDTWVRIVDRQPDGIIVRGTKCIIAGAAVSDYIFIMSGKGFKEDEKDYAVAVAIPRDAKGLTMVENRRVNDVRDLEDGFDNPVPFANNSQYIILDDVFVPNEMVFMDGEYKYAANTVAFFTANYRATIGACVAGQGSMMVGAGINIARCNGIAMKKVLPKLLDMVSLNETTYAIGLGAIVAGKELPSGVWRADPLLSHTNKIQVAKLPYETKRILQDIAGGFVENGCLPSSADFPMVEKYMAAGCSGETRARTARLIEWFCQGAGIPGCMHGGGSPDSAKLVQAALTPFEKYAKKAAELAGINEEIIDPK